MTKEIPRAKHIHNEYLHPCFRSHLQCLTSLSLLDMKKKQNKLNSFRLSLKMVLGRVFIEKSNMLSAVSGRTNRVSKKQSDSQAGSTASLRTAPLLRGNLIYK